MTGEAFTKAINDMVQTLYRISCRQQSMQAG